MKVVKGTKAVKSARNTAAGIRKGAQRRTQTHGAAVSAVARTGGGKGHGKAVSAVAKKRKA